MRSVRQPSLGQLLVAPQGQLAPQRPSQQVVGMPHALPQNIRFGSSPPGLAQSSRFSGGVVNPQAGSTSFNAPPDFTGPSYSSPVVHPYAVAASALGLALGGHSGGGYSPPPGQPPPGPGLTTAGTPPDVPWPGIHDTANQVAAGVRLGRQRSSRVGNIAAGYDWNTPSPSNPVAQILAAALANSGQRPNPSRGTYNE